MVAHCGNFAFNVFDCSWLLDTSASYHVTVYVSKFQAFMPYTRSKGYVR